MTITSPSGRKYEWNKATPPAEEDIAALQAFDASQAGSEAPQPVAEPSPQPQPAKGYRPPEEVIPPGMMGNSFGIPIPTQSDMGIAPRMAGDAALEGVGAAVGQAVGGMAPGPVKPLGMAAGRIAGGALGNMAAQKRRIAAGEQDKMEYGQMAGAGVAAAIPGVSLAGAPIKAVAKEAMKAGVGNVAAMATQTGLDNSRLPTPTEAGVAMGTGMAGSALARWMSPDRQTTNVIEKAVLKQTVAEVRAAGYPIDPLRLNPSWATKKLASIAGKAATSQEVAIRAQEVTTALARKELGLPVNAPLTRESLNAVRKEAAEPYRQVASLSEQAAKDVEALNLARSEARGYHKSYAATSDYEQLQKARAADREVKELERKIGQHAVAAQDPGLVYELDAARTKIAKVHDIEDGLALGDGNIAAGVILRAHDSGKKLSGNLKTIAKYASAFPMDSREARRVPTPGVNQLSPYAGAGMASVAAGNMGAPGLLAGGIPLLSDPARAFLLSEWNQNRAVNRFLSPPQQPISGVPLLLRQGAMAAGR